MALQASTVIPPTTVVHSHYHYRIFFNDISCNISKKSCNLESQKCSVKKMTGTDGQSIYLVYANEKACISADVIGTKQASAATTKRDFEVEIVTIYTVVRKLMPSGHISHRHL